MSIAAARPPLLLSLAALTLPVPPSLIVTPPIPSLTLPPLHPPPPGLQPIPGCPSRETERQCGYRATRAFLLPSLSLTRSTFLQPRLLTLEGKLDMRMRTQPRLSLATRQCAGRVLRTAIILQDSSAYPAYW
ncbi:hypothetical protein E2C01_007833 [Portunus trituberculatus]|uniref:Uncharacterized protein n=1 Tax=Portunus trituberculatus TaxID=210409 RepID=A0A5B7D021_PORTR|nr:hypothetical protein [Portunus trituberculatus]